MKAEEIEGRVKLLENAMRLQYPNAIIVFEIEYLTNEKQLYIYGDDAVSLSLVLGTELKAGKDGYYTCIAAFAERFIYQYAQELGRSVYKFEEITKIKTNNNFSLN